MSVKPLIRRKIGSDLLWHSKLYGKVLGAIPLMTPTCLTNRYWERRNNSERLMSKGLKNMKDSLEESILSIHITAITP
jgi:hypothetical protein